MLVNAEFTEKGDQDSDDWKVGIDPKISIKLIDFGVAEKFRAVQGFCCNKPDLSVDDELFQAPEVRQLGCVHYDARSADMWQVGLIYYQCITNQVLYQPEDIWFGAKNGYKAVIDGQLKQWLKINNLLKYFKKSSFDFLKKLLQFNPKQRLTASQCVAHTFFKSYCKAYKSKCIPLERSC